MIQRIEEATFFADGAVTLAKTGNSRLAQPMPSRMMVDLRKRREEAAYCSEPAIKSRCRTPLCIRYCRL